MLNKLVKAIKSVFVSNPKYLNIAVTRKVKTPNHAHSLDAGIDFYIPEDITEQEFLEKCETTGIKPYYEINECGFISKIVLNAGDAVLIPSGIKVCVPEGYMLQYINKSGVASKLGLTLGACVIDSGYDGICHINLIAQYNRPVEILAGQKIAQGILIPVSNAEVTVVDSEVITILNSKLTSRGSGGFGSTAHK